MKQHNLLGLHCIDVPLQLERKTKGLKDDDAHAAYIALYHVFNLMSGLLVRCRYVACMLMEHQQQNAPKLPPTASASATTMKT